MEESNEIETFIAERLATISLEDEAITEFFARIVEEESMEEPEKREAITELLADVTEETTTTVIDDVFIFWNNIKEEEAKKLQEEKENAMRIAKEKEKAALMNVFNDPNNREGALSMSSRHVVKNMTREERKKREALLAQYAYDLDEMVEGDDGEMEIVYKDRSSKSSSSVSTSDPLLMANKNKDITKQIDARRRAEMKQASESEKERNKLALEKQRLAKEKEARRTQKDGTFEHATCMSFTPTNFQMYNSPSFNQNLAILSLPFEILEQTFLELPLKSRYACLTVCKHLYHAAIAALYNSISTSGMVYSDSSLTPFKKHAHLIKEITWKVTEPFCLLLEETMQFLTHQLGDNDTLDSPRLTSFVAYGPKTGVTSVSLRQVLEYLPVLKNLKISNYILDPLDIHWFNSQSTSNTSIRNNLGVDVVEYLIPAKAKPLFALQKLDFVQAFRVIADYNGLFSMLPNLTHLKLIPWMDARSWDNDVDLFHPVPDIPWNEIQAQKFFISMIRHCPNLRNIKLKGMYNATVILDYKDYIPGAKYNLKDNKSPFEKILPLVLLELAKPPIQKSSESLNWLVNTCGSGITTLFISLTGRPSLSTQNVVLGPSDTNPAPISSQDLRLVLEECPNLIELVARGRVLKMKDIAVLNAISTSSENGVTGLSDSDCSLSIRPKPWACCKRLKRLVIGIMAESDDPEEHGKAWAQLGKAHRLNVLELCPTNLIPRLSHGLGALSGVRKISEFTIEKWTDIRIFAECNTASNDKSHRIPMLDLITVKWMGKNWTTLCSLRLDEKDATSREEMEEFIQKEKDAGRMSRAYLSTQRSPLFDIRFLTITS
ncbi:hypothetical protein BGZ76_010293 [Entomortierella beljakovae]|nr:hypothetical protein BGZ76_010293 [Entomortierella beljakovae]